MERGIERERGYRSQDSCVIEGAGRKEQGERHKKKR